ncbi:MAG: ACP S-malonyltransferase [Blastocatellia bacterium]
MTKIAFIFPGQGSQATGMGRELAAQFPVAQAVFDEADAALGFKISELCFNGPDEELQLTANTQPAILTTSIVVFRVLAEHGITPDFVAGHSLGEYSALVAAGALTLSDAVKIVRRRGELMQEAVPVGVGAMAAILGLDAAKVSAACAEASQGQVCSPANFNTPVQTVIAGNKEAVERACAKCIELGAKRAIPLKVSAPFHCALMLPAQEQLTPTLNATIFSDLATPLVNNVDAALVTAGDVARDGLIRQVSAAVRWTESVEKMMAAGVDTFVEVGPGKVLCGLVKSISKEVKLLNVENPASLQDTLTKLRAATE